eukprot:tig00000865_g5097.t1
MKLKFVFGTTSILVPCKPEQTVSQVGADAVQRVAKTTGKAPAAFVVKQYEDLDGAVLDGGDAIGDLLKDGDTVVANYTENTDAALAPAGSHDTSSGYSIASLRISEGGAEPPSPAKQDEPAVDMNVCPSCQKEITEGTVTKALGRRWHAACFVCSSCKASIGSKFNQQDGKPFCKACFENLHAQKCDKCEKPITESVVEALGGRHFHPECFRCGQCEKAIEGGFVEKDEKAFCEECFTKYNLPECAKCGVPIEGAILEFAEKMYHEACFRCGKCAGALPDTFCSKDGEALCDACAGVEASPAGAPAAAPPGMQQQEKLLVRFFV